MLARQQAHEENWLAALWHLFSRNQRRYGGYIVHFGMVLIFVGISGVAFTKHDEITVKAGEKFMIGRFALQLERMDFGNDAAKQWMAGELTAFIGNTPVQKMRPEKRVYVTHEQPTTEVALLSTWRDDLYVVLAGYDEKSAAATFSLYVNPLVRWLWIGGWVMALGTVLAMIPLSRGAKPAKREPISPTRKHEQPRQMRQRSLQAAREKALV